MLCRGDRACALGRHLPVGIRVQIVVGQWQRGTHRTTFSGAATYRKSHCPSAAQSAVQVNDAIGTEDLHDTYMGDAGFRNVGASPGTFRFQSARTPASVVEFQSGGTQRLPRLLDMNTCIEMICNGTSLKSETLRQTELFDVFVDDHNAVLVWR